MTPSTYFVQLAPELCVIGGACLVFLIGVSKNAFGRALVTPLSVLALAMAMALTSIYGQPVHLGPAMEIQLTSFSWFVRWLTLGVGLLIVLINWDVPADNERGEFFGMLLCSLAGLMLCGTANDLLTLFLALELVSVPTYVIVALSRTDHRASEASVKYFFLGALAAAITAYGFSFLYGAAGTTMMHSTKVSALADVFGAAGALNPYALVGLILALSGLFFKIAAVPFHAYVPDVYEGAASPVTGMLGFLPKAAGFIAIIKLLTVCTWQWPDALMWLIWIVAAATMTVGNVLALLQKSVKRMLAYSSISHSGYILIGVLVGPSLGEGPMRDGVAAAIFYLAVYGIMNLGAFGLLACLDRNGESAETLDDLAGVAQRAPVIAIGLAICIFSLMGFPPTAGFLGKVYLFSSALSVSESNPFHGPLVALVVIAVINTAIGAAYYLRVVASCFLREPDRDTRAVGGLPMHWALTVCSVTLLVLFVRPTGLTRQAQQATTDLIELSPSSIVDQTPPPSPIAATDVALSTIDQHNLNEVGGS